MIYIGKPYVKNESDKACLCAEVSIPKEAACAYMKAVAPKREFLLEDYTLDYDRKPFPRGISRGSAARMILEDLPL